MTERRNRWITLYIQIPDVFLNLFYSAGGVIITSLQGKIVVDNTLEARLEIVKEEVISKRIK